MNNQKITDVYVELLHEGSEMWRLTQAIESQEGLWEVLPTQDYDSEEETWLHPPRSLVRLKPSSRGDVMAVHPDPSAVRIQMPMTGGDLDVSTAYVKPVEGEECFEILPLSEHPTLQRQWLFPPKTKVRLEKRKMPFGEQVWPREIKT
jgi:hypothetical protein